MPVYKILIHQKFIQRENTNVGVILGYLHSQILSLLEWSEAYVYRMERVLFWGGADQGGQVP